jgi:hypothetical protein
MESADFAEISMKDNVMWVHLMQIHGCGYHIVELYGIFVEYVKEKLGESTKEKL